MNLKLVCSLVLNLVFELINLCLLVESSVCVVVICLVFVFFVVNSRVYLIFIVCVKLFVIVGMFGVFLKCMFLLLLL